jgi:hypothetical protein
MLALYRSGRQAEALDVARSTRRILDDQLGIDPGAGLRELELAILRQDDDTLLLRRVAAASPTTTPGDLPGRGRELQVLASAAADARAGRPTVVLVTGEAGIGKTRLVQEATGALEEFRVLTGRCTDLEGTPPYWPWRQVVAHLGPSDPLPVASARGGDADVPAASSRPSSSPVAWRPPRRSSRSHWSSTTCSGRTPRRCSCSSSCWPSSGMPASSSS